MSLEPRIIKGLQADYFRASWSGKNDSGLRPIGTSVLVLMDQCSTTTSGEAGAALLEEAGIKSEAQQIEGHADSLIVIPPEIIEKMNHASESGTVVAVGSAAFRYYDDGSAWTDYKPKPGDHVFTERYAGREIRGADGKTYRMMTYTNIGGLHDDAPDPVAAKVRAAALAKAMNQNKLVSDAKVLRASKSKKRKG